MLAYQAVYNNGIITPIRDTNCLSQFVKGGDLASYPSNHGGYRKPSVPMEGIKEIWVGEDLHNRKINRKSPSQLEQYTRTLIGSKVYGSYYRTNLFASETPYICLDPSLSFQSVMAYLSPFRILWEDPLYTKNILEFMEQYDFDIDTAIVMAGLFESSSNLSGRYRWGNHFCYRTCHQVEGYLKCIKSALKIAEKVPSVKDCSERSTFHELISSCGSPKNPNFGEIIRSIRENVNLTEDIFYKTAEAINA